MSVKVSIIMPSLNVAEYIEECLLSALNQTLKEIEIICIDAGSTDGTWEILQKYAQDNKWSFKIRLIHSEVKSYGYQVNLGIKESKGDYIAILETDDYVELNMYEELYKIACDTDVDFVKADFDNFVTLPNKQRDFKRMKLWWSDVHDYNKVICPQQNLYLHKADFNVWKGIYKKSFLVQNDIYFNESPGAAYQDIGFMELVLACAKKAYYSDASYYRYCLDRELSSVNSVHGLKYSYQEFKRLLEDENISKKIVYKEGLYYHMILSVVGEYNNILPRLNFELHEEYIEKYYNWFKAILTKCFDEHSLPVADMDEELIFQLKQILYNNEQYNAEKKKIYLQNKENYDSVVQACVGRKVFLFGAGKYGKRIIGGLYKINIEPSIICDNNSNLWGTKFEGIDILSPKDGIEIFNPCDSIFVIANKLHIDEIRNQIVELGIDEKLIVDGSKILGWGNR